MAPATTTKRVLDDLNAQRQDLVEAKRRRLENLTIAQAEKAASTATRGDRIAKLSQKVPKSSFEGDLEKLARGVYPLSSYYHYGDSSWLMCLLWWFSECGEGPEVGPAAAGRL